MKIHILISLSVLYSSTWAQTCSSTNRDCSCTDVSYTICHTPWASHEQYVGSLEECIQTCDLFGSFGQCKYLLYWGSGQCKLISYTPLDQYLDACRVVGQPLRDAYGDCLALDECSSVGCTSGCHTCDDDTCGLYAQTECSKEGSPGETFTGVPDYMACLNYCTLQSTTYPWTYLVYDIELQECICYPDGLRSCLITAVPYGMTLSQVEHCVGLSEKHAAGDGCLDDADCKPPTPVCSVLTGRCVECETNTDCTDSTKAICNTNANICEADQCSTCQALTATCDPITGDCVECLDDSGCSGPKPICDVADQICKAGI